MMNIKVWIFQVVKNMCYLYKVPQSNRETITTTLAQAKEATLFRYTCYIYVSIQYSPDKFDTWLFTHPG